MSNKFKISTARLAEIIKEEYASILDELDGRRPDVKKTKSAVNTEKAATDVETEEDNAELTKEESSPDSMGSIRDLIRKELQSL
jgi:hypothetical protein